MVNLWPKAPWILWLIWLTGEGLTNIKSLRDLSHFHTLMECRWGKLIISLLLLRCKRSDPEINNIFKNKVSQNKVNSGKKNQWDKYFRHGRMSFSTLLNLWSYHVSIRQAVSDCSTSCLEGSAHINDWQHMAVPLTMGITEGLTPKITRPKCCVAAVNLEQHPTVFYNTSTNTSSVK